MNHSKKPAFKAALDFEGKPLAMCLEIIAEQKRLLSIAQSCLPSHISEHAMHCVISGAQLLIYTDSALWASQIRFYFPLILNKMQEAGQRKITNVRIKVLPPIGQAEMVRAVRVPARQTVQAILDQVDEKSKDVLDMALSRLANTLRKRLVLEADP